MGWNLLIVAIGIMYLAFIIVLLWGVKKTWKVNKFIGFILLVLAIGMIVGGYALFGDRIKSLFQ